MTSNISMLKYGSIISDKIIGEKIYSDVNDLIKKGDLVNVDLADIKSMATFNAKQIFGRLYIELGSTVFFEKIALKNASDNIKLIIRIGILNAIEEAEENHKYSNS